MSSWRSQHGGEHKEYSGRPLPKQSLQQTASTTQCSECEYYQKHHDMQLNNWHAPAKCRHEQRNADYRKFVADRDAVIKKMERPAAAAAAAKAPAAISATKSPSPVAIQHTVQDEEDSPRYYPTLPPGSDGTNATHPKHHEARAQVENHIWQRAGPDCVDIGGRPRRHLAEQRRVTLGRLTGFPDDHEYVKSGRFQWSEEAVVEVPRTVDGETPVLTVDFAQEGPGRERFTALPLVQLGSVQEPQYGRIHANSMSVHRLYYLTIEDVIEICDEGDHWAAHHLFFGDCGSHTGGIEDSWTRDEDGRICASIDGNATTYIHSDLAWTKLGHYGPLHWSTELFDQGTNLWVTRFSTKGECKAIQHAPRIVARLSDGNVAATKDVTIEAHTNPTSTDGSDPIATAHVTSFLASRTLDSSSINAATKAAIAVVERNGSVPPAQKPLVAAKSVTAAVKALHSSAASIDLEDRALHTAWYGPARTALLANPTWYQVLWLKLDRRLCGLAAPIISSTIYALLLALCVFFSVKIANYQRAGILQRLWAYIVSCERGWTDYLYITVPEHTNYGAPLFTALISPILEEQIKRLIPPVGRVLVAVAMGLLDCCVWQPEAGLGHVLFRVAIHLALSWLPLWPAVGLHMAYNTFAVVLQLVPMDWTSVVCRNYNIEMCGTALPTYIIVPGIAVLHALVMPHIACDNPNVRLGPQSYLPTKRQTLDHISMLFTKWIPFVHATGPINELWAICHRIYGNTEPIVEEVVDEFVVWFATYLATIMDLTCCPMCTMFDDHYSCKRAWLVRYGLVLREWYRRVEEDDYVTASQMHQVVLFVKKDKQKYAHLHAPELPIPRPITSPHKAFHVLVGYVCWAQAKFLARECTWEDDDYFPGGATLSQLNWWFQSVALCVVFWIGDFSRFDRALHRKILRCVYEVLYGSRPCIPRAMYRAMLRSLNTVGVSMHGRTRYKVKHSRRSGDPETTGGNTVINLGVIRRGVEIAGAKARLMGFGDDSVGAGCARLEKLPISWFRSLGFTPKPKFVYNILDVEFCSKRPWVVNGNYYLGPKLGRFFSRIGLSHLPKCPDTINTICAGLELDVLHVPFVRLFVAKLSNRRPDPLRKTSFFADDEARANIAQGPQADTWAMCQRIYGLGPAEERTFQLWLDGWDGFPCLADNPLVDRMCEIDLE